MSRSIDTHGDDCSLIQKCKGGDREALKALFIRHAGLIQRVALRMSLDRDMREDVFQEVAKQVIVRIGTFRGDARFSTWLYRITVNTALKLVRAEKRHSAVGFVEECSVSNECTDSAAERRQTRRGILRALAELSSRQRECASLYYFAEMGVAEIADMLSIRENAVKAALFKARKNLTVDLQQKGVVP